MNLLVLHREDADGATLLRELRRAGGTVRNVWPPPSRLPAEIDVLFYVPDDAVRELLLTRGHELAPPSVAVVDGRGAHDLKSIQECAPTSLLFRPIVPDHVLPTVCGARQVQHYQTRLLRRIAKLDETLRSIRDVERAKAILMTTRQLDEHEAYHFMRRRAMEKRVPIGMVASTIIDASEILG